VLVVSALPIGPAEGQRGGRAAATIARSEARLLRIARGRPVSSATVHDRNSLRRVLHESGRELLHAIDKGWFAPPRRVNERAVHLTARHLDLPMRSVPPVAAVASTVFGDAPGVVTPWLSGVRKLGGSLADPSLRATLDRAARRHPETIDWESVHAVLLLDYVVDQDDRGPHNVFFRERRGRLTAIALDNEHSFGHRDSRIPVSATELAALVTKAAPHHEAARSLSPRLKRGLAAVDLDAWKADLRRAGIDPHEIDRAAGRLAAAAEHGLESVLIPEPPAPRAGR
jgi:hypothetical protein